MDTAAEIVELLEEVGAEMRSHSIFARAEKAHQKDISDLDSAAYIQRERFHQQDMRDASGIFQEAVSEVCVESIDGDEIDHRYLRIGRRLHRLYVKRMLGSG